MTQQANVSQSSSGKQDIAKIVPTPQKPGHPVRKKGLWYRNRIALMRAILYACVLAGWQVFAGKPGESWVLIDSYYVSTPKNMISQLYQWLQDGTLLPHLWSTTQVTLLGFLFGAGLGIVIGFLFGTNELLANVMNPFVTAVNSVPKLALMPLLLLWFGMGMNSKVALVVTTTFFVVFNNTFSGAREVSRALIDTVRVMGATRWHIYRIVTLPSALVWVTSGFRVSIPLALAGAVIGEMQSSNKGIGYLLQRSSGNFNVHGTFAAILIIMVMALVLDYGVNTLERRLLKWKYA